MIACNFSPQFNANRKIKDHETEYTINVKSSQKLEEEFYLYSKNFHDAAFMLVKALFSDNHPNIAELDAYFFTIAFLYRHSLELILKAIAFKSIIEKEDRIVFVKETKHDLRKILDKLIDLDYVNADQKEIVWIVNYFDNLSQMDRKSDSFRYPFHIKREKIETGEVKFSIKRIFEKQIHIDLRKFAAKFEISYDILNNVFLENDSSVEKIEYYNPCFIEEGGTYYGQSVVGFNYFGSDYSPYFKAYTETADFIFIYMKDKFDKGNIAEAEKYFMPMCYLYRNSVELSLKSIWFNIVKMDNQKKLKIVYDKKHSVSGMWNQIRKWNNESFGNQCEISWLDDIEKCCSELQNYDQSASCFRYPCSKNMEMFYSKNIKLDFVTIAEFMRSLIDNLDNLEYIWYERLYENN